MHIMMNPIFPSFFMRDLNVRVNITKKVLVTRTIINKKSASGRKIADSA